MKIKFYYLFRSLFLEKTTWATKVIKEICKGLYKERCEMDFSLGSHFQNPSLRLWGSKKPRPGQGCFTSASGVAVRCSQMVICGASLKNEWEANNTFTPGSTACFTAFAEDPILSRLVWLISQRTPSFSSLLLLRFDKRDTESLGRDKLQQSDSFTYCITDIVVHNWAAPVCYRNSNT